MEAHEHPQIPTPLLLIMSGIIWVFNNYFLIDLEANPTITGAVFLFVGYFVEIATAILVCIRIYENRHYAVRLWNWLKKLITYIKSLRP